jgi:hypothetical protein
MAAEHAAGPAIQYDAFLGHSHDDVEFVEALARKLEDEAGLTVWLDRWALVPGELWQPAMARGLEQAGSLWNSLGSPPGRRSRLRGRATRIRAGD